MKPLKKVVFPVAGLGTRFLPATKSVPKELLPLVDKPLIQRAAEEAVEAGADTLIFVTSTYKHAISDHFNAAHELEKTLEEKGRVDLLRMARHIVPDHVRVVFVNQPKALGLGHAVACARPLFSDDDEPFGVILPDDMIFSEEQGCLAQMYAACVYHKTHNAIAIEEIPREKTSNYGIVELENIDDHSGKITSLVEKPSPEDAPSNLAVAGRYVLNSRIFDILENTVPGIGGEIQLTDAIAKLLEDESVVGVRFNGRRYDCGSKAGFLEATVDYALRDPKLGPAFADYLKKTVAAMQ